MILRHLSSFCLIYVAMVLQSCVANDCAIHSFRPWFPGIALASCVLMHHEVAGVVWAAILGLAVDGLAAEPLGVHLVVTTSVAMGLTMTRQDIRSSSTVLFGVFVLIGTFIWRFASMTTHAILSRRNLNFEDYLTTSCGDGVYSATLAVGVAMLFFVFQRALGRQETSNSIALNNRWAMLTR